MAGVAVVVAAADVAVDAAVVEAGAALFFDV